MLPDDLTESLLLDVLDGVRVLYVNGRSREAELLLAQKVTNALFGVFWTHICAFYLVLFMYVTALSDSSMVFMQAHSKNISILINAEKKRAGLDELLDLADYAICSTNFPQVRVFSEHFCN